MMEDTVKFLIDILILILFMIAQVIFIYYDIKDTIKQSKELNEKYSELESIGKPTKTEMNVIKIRKKRRSKMKHDVEDLRNKNNRVEIEGIVVTNPEYHHSTYGESIFSFEVEILRLNTEVSDILRVEVSERLIDIESIKVGVGVNVQGQFRSFNKTSDSGKRTLDLFVFTKEISIVEDVRNINIVELEGYLCKDAVFRTTPKGRDIADLLVAINRNYGKSDYIPCITWGRNAKFSSNLGVGTGVNLEGRIQSRNYTKKLENDEVITRRAYEVSVSKISIFKDVEENESSENKE